MARKRISEFRTKTLLSQEFGVPYTGQLTNDELQPTLHPDKQYVVKVDQGIKGRFKKGLVGLDQSAGQVNNTLKALQQKGYSQFIIEEHIAYDQSLEQYLSINRIREGYRILYSAKGGVNIEHRERPVDEFTITHDDHQIHDFAGKTHLPVKMVQTLLHSFDRYYFSFLEINPFIIYNGNFIFLDAAAEVDSTAEFFVDGAWSEDDFTEGLMKQKTPEEKNVQQLAAKSQAAFSLEVLNPHGSIFMMLSGGGASIVLADEVHNQGFGKELANYGEYSGNPNAEETYLYAKNIVSLLIHSQARRKALIIAGGVANFTDVRKTFTGVIRALDEMKNELQKQHIQVFVRRGGPYQKEGLAHMKQFLETSNLLGIVAGPEMVLTDIVTKALGVIKYD